MLGFRPVRHSFEAMYTWRHHDIETLYEELSLCDGHQWIPLNQGQLTESPGVKLPAISINKVAGISSCIVCGMSCAKFYLIISFTIQIGVPTTESRRSCRLPPTHDILYDTVLASFSLISWNWSHFRSIISRCVLQNDMTVPPRYVQRW